MHEFSEEEYNLMKKYGGTCLKCGCKNSIQEKGYFRMKNEVK